MAFGPDCAVALRRDPLLLDLAGGAVRRVLEGVLLHVAGEESSLRRSPPRTRSLWPGGPGWLPTQASHGSGRARERIRLVRSRACCARSGCVAKGRTRKRDPLQQTSEAIPCQTGLVGAASKPLPPEPFDLVSKAGQPTRVAQQEIAALLERSQGQVSETERRQDVRLSTLRSYVEALGGELEVVATFGDKRIKLHSA
jgi:hypothetical protein